MISIIIQVVELRGNTSYLNSCKVSQTSWQRVAQNAVTRKNTIVRCVLSSAQNYLSELKSLAWDVSCQSGLSGSFEISFMWVVAKKGIVTGREGESELVSEPQAWIGWTTIGVSISWTKVENSLKLELAQRQLKVESTQPIQLLSNRFVRPLLTFLAV